ncbi:hypothetical protein [Phoenicibacter congonensis]|uniref:hypothetical protein n=1 Tax=Phoenicibacter congonensis TaxID=1944646 RepID=UPI0018D3D616|nr:hypothetical protein [Phoenicibacter congonensis]
MSQLLSKGWKKTKLRVSLNLRKNQEKKESQELALSSRYGINLTKNHLPNSVQTGLKKREFLNQQSLQEK